MESTNTDPITDKPLALKTDGVQQALLEMCRSLVNAPETQAGTQSPISPSSTLVTSPTAIESEWDKTKVDRTLLITNYADAFTDTYGLPSGAPFMFKTGSPWPKATGGPHVNAFRRKLHPISSDHPIVSVWDNILTDIIAYLKRAGETFNGVVPLGFGNTRELKPFCPLVVTICVKPQTIEFETAKTAANHIKTNILTPAGFGDIDVAVWGLDMSFSGAAKLMSLEPATEGPYFSAFRHPFASTLGLAIAPFRERRYEGTLGLFMTRGDGSEILAITAAHVARPPPMFPENRGVSEKSAERHREVIVALGDEAYELAVVAIQKEIGNLQKIIEREEKRLKGFDTSPTEGRNVESTTRIVEDAKTNKRDAETNTRLLSNLHHQVTSLMSVGINRTIGHVLFADPIGASSDKADAYTRDWAALKMWPDTFGDRFQGNKIYIGDKLDEQTFLERMFPDSTDREGYGYPEYGLLQLHGVVPVDELINFKHRNANGDPALGVLKNGRTTGTTSGWVSALKSGVHRHYPHINHTGIDFWPRELIIVAHEDERGAFSEKGDSGAVIVDRAGRIVALLTGGAGLTVSTDVTFATPFCQLEKRIKEALPGARLLDPLN